MDERLIQNSRTFGLILYVFGVYTLIIKYVLPVGWAVKQGEPLTTYIYFWDAWWAAHWAVGYGLRNRRSSAVWNWAMALTVAEILIIGIKFVMFLPNPNWDFWHLNWFINKSLMIVFFFVLLAWLLKKEVRDGFKKA